MKIDPSKPDFHLQLAQRLMAERGIETEDHVLLSENLASGLAHLVKPEQARALLGSAQPWQALQERAGSERWLGKVARDLAQPYTDVQVVQHIQRLEAQLSESMNTLLVDQSAPYPVQVFLQGSLLKGRLGANSDLDVMVETSHPEISWRAEQLYLSQSEDGVTVRPVSAERPGFNQFMRMLSGPEIEVPIDPSGYQGFLLTTYQGILREKGIDLSAEGQAIRHDAGPRDRREVSKAFSWACERVWSEDMSPEEKLRMVHHRSLKSMMLHAVGGAIGSLALGPLGPVVRAALHPLVRQE